MDSRRNVDISQVSDVPIVPRRISWKWGLFAAAVGPVVSAVCAPLEPAPSNPNALPSAAELLLGFALLVAWGGAAATGLSRRPSALTWASMVTALSLAMTIACPVSGHHTGVGMWFVGELLVCGAAFAVAMTGWDRVRTGRT